MEKILIMKLRHHGDVLLSTALYRALKEEGLAKQVDVLIYKETTPLLENNPHINNVLVIDRKLKGWARVKAEIGLLLRVRLTRYDAVVHLTDQWIGALIARYSRAPVRVEQFYAKRDSGFWHNSFTHCVRPPARGEAHAVELNLLCLQALGKNPSDVRGKMALIPSAERLKQADELLTKHSIGTRFVLIHPAARWPFKCWEDESFAEVVAFIMSKGYSVVLTCSPDDIELAMTQHIEQLARQKVAGTPGAQQILINLGGKMNLPLLAAMIQKCVFYVGVDSAPMHMAAALDKPQVALFGPSWVNEWKPWSDVATVIWAGDYGPLPHPDSINTDDHTRLLRAIPLTAVTDEVDRLIQKFKLSS